ncbi:MAG: pyridoxal phosphate-dependent aminotransferase [Polyangiales bacterium]
MPRFPNIAEHAHSVSARVYSKLAQRARAENAEVFPLHVGDTYRDPVPAARAERQLSDEHPGLHKYAPVQGEPSAIDAFLDYVQARHGETLDRELVQVMSGATAGLSIVCQVLLEPWDEVLLPSPFWPLSRGIIATKGAVPVQVPFYTRLDEPGFDPEAALEAAVTERTVALYVNTPNNPSGRVLSADAIEAMLRVAKRHDLWLFCDEAYEEIYFDREPPEAIWKRPETRDRAIAFHTLSKTYGFAGARIGFTHGPKRVMGAVRGMQTFHTYCAARPMQFGAVGALREGGGWVEESRALYRDAGYLAADALGVSRPEGGTFLFLDVSGLLEAGAEDCSAFLERCADGGVLLTPGRSCGDDYARWVRLCFTSVPPARLAAALEKLAPLFRTPS